MKSIVKGTKSVSEYLKRVKTTVNTLTSIGDPITHRENLDAIFYGLPEDFNSHLPMVFHRGSTHSISDVEAMIVSLDARLERSRKKQLQDASLNVAQIQKQLQDVSLNVAQGPSHSSHGSSGPSAASISPAPSTPSSGHGGDYGQGFAIAGGGYGGAAGNNGSYSGRGNGYGGRGHGRGGRSVQCQICWKYGHDASICYHRLTPPADGSGFSQPNSFGPPRFGPPTGSSFSGAPGVFGYGLQFGPQYPGPLSGTLQQNVWIPTLQSTFWDSPTIWKPFWVS